MKKHPHFSKTTLRHQFRHDSDEKCWIFCKWSNRKMFDYKIHSDGMLVILFLSFFGWVLCELLMFFFCFEQIQKSEFGRHFLDRIDPFSRENISPPGATPTWIRSIVNDRFLICYFHYLDILQKFKWHLRWLMEDAVNRPNNIKENTCFFL